MCLAIMVSGRFPLPPQCLGQDLRELQNETTFEIQLESRRLAVFLQHVKHSRQRIDLLRELKRLRSIEIEFQATLDKAEGAAKRDLADKLEADLLRIELGLDRQESLLELNDRKAELLELQIETVHEGLESLHKTIQEHVSSFALAEQLVHQRYRSSLEGKGASAESAAERLERFHDELDDHIEVCRIRFGIFWAKEEGENEELLELQRELRAIEQRREKLKSLRSSQTASAIPAIVLDDSDWQAAEKLTLQDDIAPKLRFLCGDCHSGDTASGDLDIAAMLETNPIVVHRSRWLHVIQQIKLRTMPPPDVEQPTDLDRRRIAAWLTRAIEDFDYEAISRPGHEPARRLTRAEYNHTIRDLIGVDLRPADRFSTEIAFRTS